MKRKISKKNWQIYAFDIETHNDVETIIKNETSMWLGCCIDETSTLENAPFFYNMKEFIEWMDVNSSKKRKNKDESRPCNNLMIYCYNTSFEWSFLLPVLLKMGYTFKENIDDTDSKVFNSVSTKTCSSVWQINIKIGPKNGLICIKDMAKIFGGGLAKVAAAFKLPTQKGEIDYRKPRLRPIKDAIKFEKYVEDHPDVYNNKGIKTWANICNAVNIPLDPKYKYKPLKSEKKYCFKDTKILMDILTIMHERNDKDFFQIISMASYSMKQLIKFGWPRSMKPYKEYRKMYPELGKEESAFLRRSVEGGICYATPKYQFVEINQKILHVDAVQMHPSSAYLHSFPYGKGEYFTGPPQNYGRYIHCCRIRISYDFAKLHSIIKLIPFDCLTDGEIVVWDFEIPTMRKIYENLKIEFIDGYRYNQRVLPWRKYYKYNMDKREEARKEENSFLVLYHKLLNNSSYGKHLEKGHNQIFENYINSDGVIDSWITDKEETNVNAKYTYLPIGSCIPAYSRVALIETALKFGWENIIYFDTDSIFCIYNKYTKKVWETQINQKRELGGWGLEEISKRGQFSAPKRYKLDIDGRALIKAAGINFALYKKKKAEENQANDYEIPYDEINIISSKWPVQRAYRAKGGTIIDFQVKEMSVQEKYKKILARNKDLIYNKVDDQFCSSSCPGEGF